MNSTWVFAPIAAMALAVVAPAAAVTVFVTPSNQTVPVGDRARIELIVDGLGSGVSPSLGAFEITVEFDPQVLEFYGVAFGAGLDLFGLGSLQIVTLEIGSIGLSEVSLESPADLDLLQLGTFSLATVEFVTKAPGSSFQRPIVNVFGDSTGFALPVNTFGGSIVVSSVVPEVSSALLLLFGLAIVSLTVPARRVAIDV